jgi:purine-binding chemotaxis protein CheW
LLFFHLGDRTVALPLSAIARVVPMAELGCPPGMPSVLEGFLNLAGHAVPVLRLDRLFGLPAQTMSRYSQLIVLDPSETSSGRFALLADRVSGIAPASAEDLRPVASGSAFNDCAEAVLTRHDAVVHLLSPSRLVLARERRILAEFSAVEQTRLDSWKAARP